MKKALISSLMFVSTLSFAYDIQKNLPINLDIVKANGKAVVLLGNQVQVGDIAPDFKVVDANFSLKTKADFSGKPLLISAVPSLDTGVCSIQTKRFNEEVDNLPQDVVMLTVSADLPFAQKRFCQAEDIDKLMTLSDSVWRDFAMNYGLLIKDMGLLARAIFVISPDDKIVYKEVVSELSEQPNYDAALAVLRSISEQQTESDASSEQPDVVVIEQ
ncbi:thiol peroxidase [Psychrosphaera aestuarii]|uniref:thiol peroxidase n=1 Tax=Psychrosphaera aestuarii TaxID=1266052 RepID=UPI001B341660|nr:thiol peroxidase [Psychrosphaera aestuarii]